MSCVMLLTHHRQKVAMHPNTAMSASLGLALLQVKLVALLLCYVGFFGFITLCESWTHRSRSGRGIVVWLLKVQYSTNW